jgi:hypothetical protein
MKDIALYKYRCLYSERYCFEEVQCMFRGLDYERCCLVQVQGARQRDTVQYKSLDKGRYYFVQVQESTQQMILLCIGTGALTARDTVL